MQRARCYLIGETAVVLELEPPVTLASQKRIWRLAQRLVDMPNVVEAIPGMNNITVILRNPESLALDAIERLQRWWEESEALEPESRFIEIPVVYGGAGGPDLAVVDDGAIDVYTAWEEMGKVRDALEAAGLKADSAEVSMIPSTKADMDAETAPKLMRLIDMLEDCDDVQEVYHNGEISDEVAATL